MQLWPNLGPILGWNHVHKLLLTALWNRGYVARGGAIKLPLRPYPIERGRAYTSGGSVCVCTNHEEESERFEATVLSHVRIDEEWRSRCVCNFGLTNHLPLLLIVRILVSILFTFGFFPILTLNEYLGITFQQSVYIGILFSVTCVVYVLEFWF